MPIYEMECRQCKKLETRYLTYKEFDAQKTSERANEDSGSTECLCSCGGDQYIQMSVTGQKVFAGKREIFLPKLCHGCRKFPKVRYPYVKGGCSNGTRCRGWVPKDLSEAKKMPRSVYNKMYQQGKGAKPRPSGKPVI